MLCLVCHRGYCAAVPVEVKLTTSTSTIFSGQPIVATVQVTNRDKVNLQLPPLDRAGSNALLSTDNPQLGFSSGASFIKTGDNTPTTNIKPGESISVQVSLSEITHDLSPISFRMGFKTTANAVPIWSNPVTVTLKKDEDVPMKLEASLKEDKIVISNVNMPHGAIAYVRITNTGSAPLDIGVDRARGAPELRDLISDNESLKTICLNSRVNPKGIILKPGQVYAQNCTVMYKGKQPNPKPISFRIGIKSPGRTSVWSNPIVVNVVGGNEQWTKYFMYLGNSMNVYTAPRPDGINVKYYDNGVLKDECVYKDGKLNGPCKRYYQNGKLWEELNYIDNKENGREKEYDKAGKLVQDKFVSDGRIVSSTIYNQDGSVHADVIDLRLVNGNYVPQHPCAKNDSDQQILQIFPKCGADQQ
jgi:hypothetical protein